MTAIPDSDLLDRVRKLLAKAEDDGCTPAEAEALTAKAADLMAYSSDLERAEILYTSVLVQMARALARQPVPAHGNSAKAWHRSWMLGYCSAVVARVRAAEETAVASASTAEGDGEGVNVQSAALVLADRSLVVRQQVTAEYPKLRRKRVTYSGSGYGDGYREGQKADIV